MSLPLIAGAAGRVIVDWFIHNCPEKEPIEAEHLDHIGNEYNYRLTFEDGSVSDWHIVYAADLSLEIESAEMYNEVI